MYFWFMSEQQNSTTEVLIVGGSYAGMSAALCLGRALRHVTIVDSGFPCNRQTPHSHNFLTRDGYTPAELRGFARADLERYPAISWINDTVTTASGHDGNFNCQLASGRVINAKKLLFASGISDLLPSIPGFAECWGISLIHCPYCHGYEVRHRNLGVIANGEAAMEFARMISHWAGSLTLFTNGPATFSREHADLLTARGIDIREEAILGLEHEEGYMSAIQLDGGEKIAKDALFFRAPFRQSCDLPSGLGCNVDEMGLYKATELGVTNVPGVYTAGDNCSPMRAVSSAVAAGTKAGAMINRDLINDEYK